MSVKKENIKTNAKAQGVKSVVTADGKTLVASFGKGNAVLVEKITDNTTSEVVLTRDPSDYAVEVQPVVVKVNKKSNKFVVDNPSHTNTKAVGQDLLRVKPYLEQEYFGASYPHDNLRIQIIHNIQDIKKMLSSHINNIVYTFISLQRSEEDAETQFDKVGMLYWQSNLVNAESHPDIKISRKADNMKAFIKKVKPYFGFFGGVFANEEKAHVKKCKKKNKDYIAKDDADIDCLARKDLEHNYDVFRLLSMVRQFCSHGKDVNNYSLYALDTELKKYPELLNVLTKNINQDISRINQVFLEHSARNLTILQSVLPDYSRAILIESFYQFTVLKLNTNVGISIKKLREAIIDNHCIAYKHTNYDEIRAKLYNITDFILWMYLKENDAILENMISELRLNTLDSGKEDIYKHYARELWHILKDKIGQSYLENVKSIAKSKIDEESLQASDIENVALKGGNISVFGKLISFICNFIDGKEINELLTSLLSKFENIDALMHMGKVIEGESFCIAPRYKLFNISYDISQEMRIIKSIGKKKEEVSINDRRMFDDALELLGVTEKYLLDANGEVLLDENGKKRFSHMYDTIRKSLFEGGDRTIFNFISNNFIKSKRYFYIIKYNNTKVCRALTRNTALMKFVLSGMEDEIITRYYISTTGLEAIDVLHVSREEMENSLLNTIHNLSINTLIDVSVLAEQKERIKAIASFYLTVIYIATKSMVKVNSRYTLAHMAYERDNRIIQNNVVARKKYMFGYQDCRNPEKKQASSRTALTQYFIDDNRYKKRVSTYIQQNIDSLNAIIAKDYSQNNGADAARIYRNNCMHLAVISNMHKYNDIRHIDSYFEFYHYVAQRMLVDSKIFAENAKLQEYRDTIIKYKGYSRDLVKVLNVPFAYNLPRYKNLSIGDLFDKDKPVDAGRVEEDTLDIIKGSSLVGNSSSRSSTAISTDGKSGKQAEALSTNISTGHTNKKNKSNKAIVVSKKFGKGRK